MLSAIEPRTNLVSPFFPCVPITMRSNPPSLISFIHVLDIQTLQNIAALSGGGINDIDLLLAEEKPVLSRLKEEAEKNGIKVNTVLTRGEPVNVVLNEIKEGGFDLIVMGTHGKNGRKVKRNNKTL